MQSVKDVSKLCAPYYSKRGVDERFASSLSRHLSRYRLSINGAIAQMKKLKAHPWPYCIQSSEDRLNRESWGLFGEFVLSEKSEKN